MFRINLIHNLVLTSFALAWFMSCYNGHLFTLTTVTENAPAKVVAVHRYNGGGILQVVVVAPPSAGGHLILLERPRARWAYQWPDVSTADVTLDVCYSRIGNGNQIEDAMFVDIDCDFVKWSVFWLNFMHVMSLVALACVIGIVAARVAAVCVMAYSVQVIQDKTPLSAIKCDPTTDSGYIIPL